MINLEEQFQDFLKAGYGDDADKKLDPRQITEVKRAFYGGLSVAAFNPNDRIKIIKECRKFFENEVKEHEKCQTK